LLAWLQSTLLRVFYLLLLVPFTPIMFGSILEYFYTKMKPRASQLYTNLHNQSLDNKAIHDYLTHIKSIVDELVGIGYPIQPAKYVDAILEGLPPDYVAIISMIESKLETPPTIKMEAFLLAYETRTQRPKILTNSNISWGLR